MSDPIRIQFTRFSAFYSPLIATIAGGFLKDEGLVPEHSIAPAGKSAIEGLVQGTVDVCQSAPSQGFGSLEKGQALPALHFAQINEKDGFFLTARAADPAFAWDTLRGKSVLVDHGGQPLAMFKYACHRKGLDYAAIKAVNVPSGQMDGAFRQGQGDCIHQQGPAPQQLEHDGVGHVVASVGEAIGPVAFSSLAATWPKWRRRSSPRLRVPCWPPRSRTTRSLGAGLRTSRSRARPSRWRSTCSSTPG